MVGCVLGIFVLNLILAFLNVDSETATGISVIIIIVYIGILFVRKYVINLKLFLTNGAIPPFFTSFLALTTGILKQDKSFIDGLTSVTATIATTDSLSNSGEKTDKNILFISYSLFNLALVFFPVLVFVSIGGASEITTSSILWIFFILIIMAIILPIFRFIFNKSKGMFITMIIGLVILFASVIIESVFIPNGKATNILFPIFLPLFIGSLLYFKIKDLKKK